MQRYAILLADTVAEKQTKYVFGLFQGRSRSNVSKGELLVAVVNTGHADDTDLRDYHLAYDDSAIVHVKSDVAVPLTDQEFILLEAIVSRLARYGVYQSGKCSWGAGLKVNDSVNVSLFQPDAQASAIIRYIGKVRYNQGTMFGVEIVDQKYLYRGHSNGTWHGKTLYECKFNRGLFVSLDRLSEVEDQIELSNTPQENGESLHPPTSTQWKSTPRSQFMDSKLKCVFVEEEPACTVTQSKPAPALEYPVDGCEDGTQQETRYFTLHKEQEHHEQEYSVLLQQKQISEEQCSLLKQQLSQQSQASQKIQEELERQLQEVSEQHQQRILLIQEEQHLLHEEKHHLQGECTALQQQVVQHREAAAQAQVQYQEIQHRLDTALAEIQQLRPSSRTQVLVEDIDPWKVSRDEVQILSEMDRGAWGYVAKGRFRGQLVAVKSPHPAILDEHTTKRLQREVRIMTQVRHPNLLRIIAAVFDNQVPHLPPLIVTELLDMNLRAAYKKNRLSEASRIPIFRDVAYALHYLHEHQEPIIHRDVSAPNVLLEELPNDMFKAKVSDFGSANLAKLAQTLAEGAIIYAAPETFPPRDLQSCPSPQTTKIDVYSYGILLCEVITCQLPDPQRLWSMLQEVKSKWSFMHDLIVSCTHYSPEDRLTMAQVLDKLNQLPRAQPRQRS